MMDDYSWPLNPEDYLTLDTAIFNDEELWKIGETLRHLKF